MRADGAGDALSCALRAFLPVVVSLVGPSALSTGGWCLAGLGVVSKPTAALALDQSGKGAAMGDSEAAAKEIDGLFAEAICGLPILVVDPEGDGAVGEIFADLLTRLGEFDWGREVGGTDSGVD